MKNTFSESGKKGAKKRWSNYRLHLIQELSKLVDKDRLNFYMDVAKSDYSGRLLREALMFHRKNK